MIQIEPTRVLFFASTVWVPLQHSAFKFMTIPPRTAPKLQNIYISRTRIYTNDSSRAGPVVRLAGRLIKASSLKILKALGTQKHCLHHLHAVRAYRGPDFSAVLDSCIPVKAICFKYRLCHNRHGSSTLWTYSS